MYLVGVTGGIGSGKTTVAQLFATQGITTIDADTVARQVVAPGQPALNSIREHFGDAVFTATGELDRRALRKKVFDQAADRRWLEALLHPLIAQAIARQVQASQSAYTVLVSPLLIESGQHKLVQRILVIDLPEALQRQRTAARDQAAEAEIEKIMSTQMPRQERLNYADDVINNAQDYSSLQQQVSALHQLYLTLSQQQP